MSMSTDDVEKLQALYPDHQIELREGKIIIQAPSDMVSGEIGARFTMLLAAWIYKHDLGRILDASIGISMPNGDLLSPDVSFVAREQLKRTSRTYLPVVPQLIVEIKSIHDRIRGIEDKIALFLRVLPKSRGCKTGEKLLL